MERRSTQHPVKVEKRADGSPAIAGYGAVFYDGTPATEYVLWDDSYGRAVERILPTAFDGALTRPDDVRGLFNHEPSQLLGRTASKTMTLSKDSVGLKYEIQPGETAISRDVIAHIQRGDVSGSSFSFSIPNAGQRWTSTSDQDGRVNEVREILAVELYDTGPVTFPAYDKTTAGVRAAGDVAEARAARDAWRKQEPAGPTPNLTDMRIAELESQLL